MKEANYLLKEYEKLAFKNFFVRIFWAITIILPAQLVKAQQDNPINLDDCYAWAKENSPVFNQLELNETISQLRYDNISSANLPQIELKGKASYQSEVTKLNLDFPTIELPELSPDHYNIYLDVSQNIYDGGLTEARRKLEEKSFVVENQNTIVDLFQINDKINQTFFNILLIEKQQAIIKVAINTLNERIGQVESAVRNQVLTANELDILLVEKEERLREFNKLNSDKKSAIRVLTLLTGRELSAEAHFQVPEAAIFPGEIVRPELNYFRSQNEKLISSEKLVQKGRNPRIYGFAQTGVGRPGLNMLSDEFKSYYLVGIGLNWKVTDWKKTAREKQIIRQQMELVNSRQEDFLLSVKRQLANLEEEIGNLKTQLKQDDSILKMRMRIAARSSSALINGEITSADYMEDLNAETNARLLKESHLIQMKYAIIRYNTVKGKVLD